MISADDNLVSGTAVAELRLGARGVLHWRLFGCNLGALPFNDLLSIFISVDYRWRRH